MENWGLITYGYSALLWDPAYQTVQELQRVSTVIAHELAHQWFGNLVTAAWWSQLWLNEVRMATSDSIAIRHFPPSHFFLSRCLGICYLCGVHWSRVDQS